MPSNRSSSTAWMSPAFVPKWWVIRPTVTPARDEIARIEVASAPLSANSSNATWRMRAFAVKSVLRSAVDIWLYLLCGMVSEVTVCVTFGLYWSSKLYGILYEYTRSEERRVGKECSYRIGRGLY